MASHSCPRCSWLVLGSTTGHSPFAEQNKRLNDEDENEMARVGGKTGGPPGALENTKNFIWRHRRTRYLDWQFHWPIGYKAYDGECELLQAFITCLQNRFDMKDEDFSIYSTLRGKLRQANNSGDDEAHLWLTMSRKYGNLLRTETVHQNLRLELFLDMDGPCEQWLRTRPIELQPGSDASFALIRSWIRDCTNEHISRKQRTELAKEYPSDLAQSCSSRACYKPTRLLHVRSSHPDDLEWAVSLIDSDSITNESVPYVALSYCWGGDQEFKTTRKSLSTNRGIIGQNLPASIKDACRATLKLGYSYLWIDALCIVQDDKAEMQREIAKMSLIYSNAVLTIAASRARSSKEGFLQSRTSYFSLPRMRAIGTNDETGEVCLIDWHGQDSEPLDQRAWAFQESLLSRRVLEFTSHATRFFCATSCNPGQTRSYRTDGWRSSRGEHLIEVDDGRNAQIVNVFPHHLPTLAAVDGYWWTIVIMYSNRELSVASDRPLAISGAAERLHQQLLSCDGHNQQATYIAGHWSFDIPYSLGWKIDNKFYPRPAKYQGPSWSWLSVSGKVTPQVQFRRHSRATNKEEVVDLIELCGFEMVLEDQSARYGLLTCATLTVRIRISMVDILDTRGPEQKQSEPPKIVRFSNCTPFDQGLWIFVARREYGLGANSGRQLWIRTHTVFDTLCDRVKNWTSKQVFLMQVKVDRNKIVETVMLQYVTTLDGIRVFRRIGHCRAFYVDSNPAYNPGEDTSKWLRGWKEEIVQLI